MKKFNKNVYGIVGLRDLNGEVVKSKVIDKLPTLIKNEDIFVNQGIIMHSLLEYWQNSNMRVFSIGNENGIEFKDEYKRYNYLFNDHINRHTGMRVDVLNNLYGFIDVKNFGLNGYGVFKEYDFNGNLFFGTGLNINKDFKLNEIDNSGNRYTADEVHYGFSYEIKPVNIGNSKMYDMDFEYSDDDYCILKNSLIENNYSIGKNMEKEFVIIIECKEKQLLARNLQNYVKVIKKDYTLPELNIDSLIQLCNMLSDRIDKIEIYYNQSLIELKLPEEKNQLNCEIRTFDIRNKH